MDLSVVARQRVNPRVEASASASASRRTEDDEDEDDLDADEAKQLVRAFVKHALDGVRSGERAQYYELLGALEGLEDAEVSQDKLLMLTVLVECVSSLDENSHEELLRKVLSVSPWRSTEEVAHWVNEFCVNLVSTHTGSLLQTCLEMLVGSFVPPPGYDLDLLERDGRWDPKVRGASPTYTDAIGRSDSRITQQTAASLSQPPLRTPEVVTQGVVKAVETILTLVPLAASVLRQILLHHVPHKSQHKTAQTQYLRCAFQVCETEAGRGLRDVLLRGVASHLLELDVEITWEHIRDPGRDSDSENNESDVEDDMASDENNLSGDAADAVFELDDIEKTIEIEMTRQAAVWERDARNRAGGQFGRNRGNAGYGTSPTNSSGLTNQKQFAVDETADTLDSMMETVLAHVDVRIDRGDGANVANCILQIFFGTLLPAHTSKFTQFLVFHVCARDAAAIATNFQNKKAQDVFTGSASFGNQFGLSGRIVDALIERITDPHHPPAGRLASAAYLASFLSRAAFLPPDFLTKALRRVTNWCVSVSEAAVTGAGVTSVGQVRQNNMKKSNSGIGLTRGFGSSFKIHESGSESGGSEGGLGLGEDPNDPGNSGVSEFANASAATLAVFDSACQCLMYVIVYRMEDVLRLGDEPADQLRKLPLLQALYNRLEPLKTCLPSVVLEFLHRASDAGLPGFDDELVTRHKAERKEAKSNIEGVTEGNTTTNPSLRRSSSSVAVLGGDLAEAVRQRRPLRMFFPFDPYLLRRSAALLRLPITYVAWRGEVRREENDEEEDLELGMDDDDTYNNMDDDDDDSDGDTDSDDDESESHGGRGGSRSGSHFGSHGVNSFGGNSLPNSLNPRPRKLTRGLLGPTPLFGGNNSAGRSVSPGSAEGGKSVGNFGFGQGIGGAAAPPIVGFGVPTAFGSGSPGSLGARETPPSPSRLGNSQGSEGKEPPVVRGRPPRPKRGAAR